MIRNTTNLPPHNFPLSYTSLLSYCAFFDAFLRKGTSYIIFTSDGRHIRYYIIQKRYLPSKVKKSRLQTTQVQKDRQTGLVGGILFVLQKHNNGLHCASPAGRQVRRRNKPVLAEGSTSSSYILRFDCRDFRRMSSEVFAYCNGIALVRLGHPLHD